MLFCLRMKKVLVLVVFFFVSFNLERPSYAYDLLGLQPVAPNGAFSSFSAESLPRNQFSVETAVERVRKPDFYRISLRTAYGLTDHIELDLTVPFVSGYIETSEGFEDIAFGLKHSIHEEGKYGPSIAYMLTASTTGNREAMGTDGRFGAGFILSKRFGPFRGHLNFFYFKPGGEDLYEELAFHSGFEFAATHSFDLLGELIVRKGHFSTVTDDVEARFGYRFRTTEHIYTTLGAGVDFRDSSPDYRLMLSVCFTSLGRMREIQKIYEQE